MPSIALPCRLLSLLLFALVPAPLRAEEGVGWVSGEASAVYRIEAPGAPAPPAVEVNGFRQEVFPVQTGWEVRVQVSAKPLGVRAPFRARPLPPGLPEGFSRDLSRSLASCRRADEALSAVFEAVRARLDYTESAGFEETPDQVLQRGRASCLGFSAVARLLLHSQGLESLYVVGLRAPVSQEPLLLQGGRLHAWLQVALPGAGEVFCDPLLSVAWVPHRYVVLRIGPDLEAAALRSLTGSRLVTVSAADRVAFEPPRGRPCRLWSRPNVSASTGGLIHGKFLGEGDRPLEGKARLEGDGVAVSMDLWEGNFFFRDLTPGRYGLLIESPGALPAEASIVLRPMDKRFLVFYSRNRGEPGRRSAP
ncbi:MAG: transglutaminase family protein [Acidobacteriota bacterium]